MIRKSPITATTKSSRPKSKRMIIEERDCQKESLVYFNLISSSNVNVTELTLSLQSSSNPFARVNGVFTTSCELRSHHLHLRCGATKIIIIMTLVCHYYNTAEAVAVAVAVAGTTTKTALFVNHCCCYHLLLLLLFLLIILCYCSDEKDSAIYGCGPVGNTSLHSSSFILLLCCFLRRHLQPR